MTDEKDFLSGYDPGEFPAFAVTADIVLLTMRAGRLCVLLIERGGPPFKGMWAFPGGFVKPDENLDRAASRELHEETGISGIALNQFASYGDPDRDPRMRVVTVSYLAVVPDLPSPEASTDAAKARFWPVDDVEGTLAFDHDRIELDYPWSLLRFLGHRNGRSEKGADKENRRNHSAFHADLL